jgi:hypothetical protein
MFAGLSGCEVGWMSFLKHPRGCLGLGYMPSYCVGKRGAERIEHAYVLMVQMGHLFRVEPGCQE